MNSVTESEYLNGRIESLNRDLLIYRKWLLNADCDVFKEHCADMINSVYKALKRAEKEYSTKH